MAYKYAKYKWPGKRAPIVDYWFGRLTECGIEVAILHGDQQRKEANVPYHTHPDNVRAMLLAMRFKLDVVIGGVFHDVLEDTGHDPRLLSWRYGARVLDLVEMVTEIPKKNSWIKRKQEMISRMINADPEAKVISACDKLDNLLSICRALRAEDYREGEDCSKALVWKSFNRGYKWQKWYFQNITKSLVANLPDNKNLPIVFGKLVRLVEVTFGEKFLDPKTRKLFNDRLDNKK